MNDPVVNQFKLRPSGKAAVAQPDSKVEVVNTFIAKVGDTVYLSPSNCDENQEIIVKVNKKNGEDYSGEVTGFTGNKHSDEHYGYKLHQTIEFIETQIFSFE